MREGNSDTALIKASAYRFGEIVALLLQVPGIDTEERNMWADTALSVASRKVHERIIKLLFQDETCRSEWGLTC